MEFKNKLVVVALSAALLLNISVFAAEQAPSRASVIARATAATVLAAYAAGVYVYNEGSPAGKAVACTALVAAAAVAPVSIVDTAKASFNWVASKLAAYRAARTADTYLMPLRKDAGDAKRTVADRDAELVQSLNRMDEDADADCKRLSSDGYEEGEISEAESELEEGEIRG